MPNYLVLHHRLTDSLKGRTSKLKFPSAQNSSEMGSATDLEGLLTGCHCGDILDDEEKTFVYAEGTKLDRSGAQDDSELSDTVWTELKPPKLFSIDYFPAVTARQVQIKRIQLQGKRKLTGDEEGVGVKEKINVSINKKKTAFQYLSNTSLTSK